MVRLRDAVACVFSEWTLVQLAISNAWAGPGTASQVQRCEARVVGMCERHVKRPMTRDQFEDALLDLVDELRAIADDGSVQSICVVLAALHAEALCDDATKPTPTTDALLKRAADAAARNAAALTQSARRAGDYDGDSDLEFNLNDDDDDNDNNNNNNNHNNNFEDDDNDDVNETPGASSSSTSVAAPAVAIVAESKKSVDASDAAVAADDATAAAAADDDDDGWTTVASKAATKPKKKR
jgi:hypothetical protein